MIYNRMQAEIKDLDSEDEQVWEIWKEESR